MTSTVINSYGQDTITVGDASGVQDIDGPIRISGLDQNNAALTLNDKGDTTPRTVQVTGGDVTGLTPSNFSFVPATIFYDPGALSDLIIDGPSPTTSSSGSVFTVLSTPSGTNTHIESGGHDTVYVGGNFGTVTENSLQYILGQLFVGAYVNVPLVNLNLNDQGDTTPRTNVIFTSSSVTGLSPAEIYYELTNAVTVNLGAQGNTFNVQSTAGPVVSGLTVLANPVTTINSLDGDTFNVGNNSVQAVLGQLVLNNTNSNVDPDSDTLNVNDEGDTTARTVKLTSGSVTGLVPAPSGTSLPPPAIDYTSFGAVNIGLGSGGDVVNVLSTPPSVIGLSGTKLTVFTTTTTIISYAPVTVDVGDANGVQDIQGPLAINNQLLPLDTLNINDQGDAGSRTATVTSTAVTGLAPATISYGLHALKVLNIDGDGSSRGNTFNVLSTAPPDVVQTFLGTSTYYTTTNLIGHDATTVNVGNSGSVQGIQGTLNLENPPNYNNITVNDTSDSRRFATISTLGANPSDSQFNSDPWGTLTGLAPAAINFEYYDTNGVTVDLPNAYFYDIFNGEEFGSSITVTPVSYFTYNINGNAFLRLPGNGLTVSSVNGTVVDHPTTTYAGYFTFQGGTFHVVNYSGIQSPSPIGLLVAGTDAGISPEIKVYNAQTGDLKFDLHPFNSNFLGGTRVAVGDLNGDGVPDIVAAEGPGSSSSGDSLVQVFDGVTGQQLAGAFGSLDPFPGFHGGLYVASADVNGDGYPDLIVGQGAGGQGWVKVFSGQDGSLLAQFQPYGPGFTDGVRLAAGPVTSKGDVDVITGAGPGGPPLVEVFDGPGLVQGHDTPIASFEAFAPSFTGGVYVATGLIHDQGHPPASIVVGEGAGGEPRVSVFDGTGTQLQTFLAFDPGSKGGVRVATADVTGSGRSDIVAAEGPAPGSLPEVRAFDGVSLQQVDDFFAFAANDRNGLFVAGGGRWGIFNPVSVQGTHPPIEQKSSATGGGAGSSTLPAIATDPAGSDPPPAPATSPMASYVASAFEDVLHRAPDESALAYWSGQLAGGLSPGEFAGDLTHSAEFYATNVITPAYRTYLGRAPDAAGIAYWTSQMQQGMTDQQIEAHFIASPEFYAHASGTNSGWVNALYQVVLGRQADSSGMSYWLAELSAGASRSTIALGFAASREREARMIQDDYFSYLGRAAAASEVHYWLDQFDEGATNEDILSGFIGSSEYVQSH